jgi:hypothetical protein
MERAGLLTELRISKYVIQFKFTKRIFGDGWTEGWSVSGSAVFLLR